MVLRRNTRSCRSRRPSSIESLEQRVLLAASIVKDINLAPEGSSPRHVVESDGTLYFGAWDRTHGGALWKSDGTQAGTSMVADLTPGNSSFMPRDLVPVNGKVFFTGNDYGEPPALWVSDGTEAGTVKLREVEPSGGGMSVAVGDKLFFQAWTPASPNPLGYELWVSDGTPAGTHLVKDIYPGVESSYPLNFGFAYDGALLFRANSGTENGLWRSDGTEAGTYRISPAVPAGNASVLSPSWVLGPGGKVYLSAGDAAHGNELWQTDGTAAGTTLVKDLEPGTMSSGVWGPSGLSMVDGVLYFRTTNASGTTLWKSDGTDSGTQPVRALEATQEPVQSPVLRPRAGGPGLFLSGKTLWRTDGTAAGTTAVKTHEQTWAGEATVSGGWLYYTVLTFASGNLEQELWRSDGTAAGTQKIPVRLPPPPSYDSPRTRLIDLGGALYFSGGTPDNELLRLAPDQTLPETIDVNPARPYGSDPHFFHRAGDYVYFLATNEGRTHVWRTDGTEAGTIDLLDTGAFTYKDDDTAVLGDSFVFTAGDKVWITGPDPGSGHAVARLNIDPTTVSSTLR